MVKPDITTWAIRKYSTIHRIPYIITNFAFNMLVIAPRSAIDANQKGNVAPRWKFRSKIGWISMRLENNAP
jgi:hypothetical protein